MTEAEWLSRAEPGAMLRHLRGYKGGRKLRLLACACGRLAWDLFTDADRAALAVAEDYADGTVGDDERREASRVLLSTVGAPTFEAWGRNNTFVAGPDTGYSVIPIVLLLEDRETLVAANTGHPVYVLVGSRHSVHDRVRFVALCTAAALADRRQQRERRVPSQYRRFLAGVLTQSGERAAASGTGFDRHYLRHPHKAQRALIQDVFGNPFRPAKADPVWVSATVRGLAEGIYADRAFDRLPILADALEEAGCDHPDILAHCRGPGPHARGCWVVDLLLGKN